MPLRITLIDESQVVIEDQAEGTLGFYEVIGSTYSLLDPERSERAHFIRAEPIEGRNLLVLSVPRNEQGEPRLLEPAGRRYWRTPARITRVESFTI